ncbi:hypothetical protein [Aureispira sp. CCB-QB1]|uniref:hypothetical protein n=1 Tax=Aureispira sp. CCB-QB1 TaxID=1313421 RepID=UPI000696EC17|nr:hypothetical protein [Aureispira sp. CCB-QB1]
MNQDTWENINMIIQDEDIQGAEFTRDYINEGNVNSCVDFYSSALNNKQKAIVITIFCSDYQTENTKKIAKDFLKNVPVTIYNEHVHKTCLWNLDSTLNLESLEDIATIELAVKKVLNE